MGTPPVVMVVPEEALAPAGRREPFEAACNLARSSRRSAPDFREPRVVVGGLPGRVGPGRIEHRNWLLA